MNVTINSMSSYNGIQVLNNSCNNKRNAASNIQFKGVCSKKVLNYAGFAMSAVVISTLLACTNSKTQKMQSDEKDSVSVIVNNSEPVENTNEETIAYYYLPSDKETSGDSYTWKETVKSDSTVEKDSMGYKIIELPNGERTVSKTFKNNQGESITTTRYSDGSKRIRVDKGKNYRDTLYYANGQIKEIKNKEVEIEHGNYPDEDKELIINQTYKSYDANGVLLFWEVFDKKSVLDENKFKYDALGRIIDDGFSKYEYQGEDDIPCKVTEEMEGCKYITEYEEFKHEEKKYFEASNGVITPYSEIYKVTW